jgi:hypothetical protein
MAYIALYLAPIGIGLPLLMAAAAAHLSAGRRLERDLRWSATISAHHRVQLTGISLVSLRTGITFPRLTAGSTATWWIVALAGKKFLVTCGESELVTAITTRQGLVEQTHDKPP